jgi:hypothetical protein
LARTAIVLDAVTRHVKISPLAHLASSDPSDRGAVRNGEFPSPKPSSGDAPYRMRQSVGIAFEVLQPHRRDNCASTATPNKCRPLDVLGLLARLAKRPVPAQGSALSDRLRPTQPAIWLIMTLLAQTNIALPWLSMLARRSDCRRHVARSVPIAHPLKRGAGKRLLLDRASSTIRDLMTCLGNQDVSNHIIH